MAACNVNLSEAPYDEYDMTNALIVIRVPCQHASVRNYTDTTAVVHAGCTKESGRGRGPKRWGPEGFIDEA